MTRHHTYPMICPNCNHTQDFLAYDSINISANPELKPLVMSTDLLAFHCDNCGYDTFVNYGYLYHDPKHVFMVYYEPQPEKHVQIAHDLRTIYFREEGYIQRKAGYRFRIVPELRDLWEKIFIFEAGLDDRVIELLKYYLQATFLEQYPTAQVERVQFYVDGETGQKQFILMHEDDIVAFIAFDPDHYDLILERWGDRMTQHESNLQLMVNAEWVEKLVSEE